MSCADPSVEYFVCMLKLEYMWKPGKLKWFTGDRLIKRKDSKNKGKCKQRGELEGRKVKAW